MDQPIARKLFYFFPILFCFCLPFGSTLLSLIIILWTFWSFFNINRSELLAGFKNRNLWLFYLFFLFTLLSALLSSDKDEALFAIEVKMSFLLFPYLLFCFTWPRDILKRCVISFVSGSFFACVYLLIRALLYSLNGHPEYFFYSDFSDFIHTSYFAMYLVMAIVFVLVLYPKWFSLQRSVIYSSYFFVAIFVTCIFLCASKLGLLSFFVCAILLLFYRWKLDLSIKKALYIIVTLVVTGALATLIFPTSFNRLKNLAEFSTDNIDKTSVESTTVRVLIWKESAALIKNNFFAGTGVGDANNELYRAYEEKGLSGAFSHKLNAHNQYLQTFIGMGFFAFLLLLYLTIGEAVKAVFQRHFLLFIFALLCTVNFMVESMLQRSAGVLFFSFFFCFLNLVHEEELADNSVIH